MTLVEFQRPKPGQEVIEEWAVAPTTEGKYLVSSLGRVRHIRSGNMVFLRTDKNGYLYFLIGRTGKCSARVQVSRIVCGAFNGPPSPDRNIGDHINRIRNDNRSINLRWVSVSESLDNRVHNRGERNHMAKLTEQEVREIRSAVSCPDRILAERYGTSRRNVNDIKRSITWAHVK